ncbi:MAG: hypothetical protein JWP45_3019 [Mucilaginibacter sp.]|nr:hypothetical protein [Mucilaginibacter sp.]
MIRKQRSKVELFFRALNIRYKVGLVIKIFNDVNYPRFHILATCLCCSITRLTVPVKTFAFNAGFFSLQKVIQNIANVN